MKLQAHKRLAMIIFWFAQGVGIVTILSLLIFIGGNLISDIFNHSINFSEDYRVFIYFLIEILIAISFIISWSRKRMGPALIIIFTLLASFLWGIETFQSVYLHLPMLFSGLLLLYYSYYKEWILKKKA